MTQGDLLSLFSAQRSGFALTQPMYTDSDVFEADLALIWQQEWIFAASAAELPKAGAYVTIQLGKYPVVIVKGADNVIRAFHNVCRHRGQRLCSKPSGQTAKLVCPYHQWTYELDGRLHCVVAGEDLVVAAVDDDRPVLAVDLEALLDRCDVPAAGVAGVGAELGDRDRVGAEGELLRCRGHEAIVGERRLFTCGDSPSSAPGKL